MNNEIKNNAPAKKPGVNKKYLKIGSFSMVMCLIVIAVVIAVNLFAAELPTTLTLLVDPMQAKLLAEYENNSKIHAVLVSRGDEKKAKAFLKEQKTMLEEIAEKEAEKEAEEDNNG